VAEVDVHVTVRVDAADRDRAVEALEGAGFRVIGVIETGTLPGHPKATVSAIYSSSDNPDEQRATIVAAEQLLARLGVDFDWGSHGVGQGAISSEWVEVVDAITRKPLGVKVSVANRFEVEQELVRVAAQLGTLRDLLDIAPRPPWLDR
jgi:hypothetical protein